MRKGHRNEKKKKSDESDNKREGVRKKGERLAVYSTFELRNVDETKEREKRKAKEKQQTKRTSKGNKPDLATMRPDCVTNCSESRPLNVSGTRRQIQTICSKRLLMIMSIDRLIQYTISPWPKRSRNAIFVLA